MVAANVMSMLYTTNRTSHDTIPAKKDFPEWNTMTVGMP